jgi:hypothetical protein
MRVMPFSLSPDLHSAPSKQHERSLFLRIIDAIGESNRRRALREVASVLAHLGGRLPDHGSGHPENFSATAETLSRPRPAGALP